MNKYEVDGIDITAEMRENMLSYYEGKLAYTIFSQPVNDMAYKRGFVHGRGTIKRHYKWIRCFIISGSVMA